MSTLVLFALVVPLGIVWGLITIHFWPVLDAKHDGRPVRMLLWGAAAAATASSTLESLGFLNAGQAVSAAAGVALPGMLLFGLMGAWKVPGRSTLTVVPVALLAFSAVISASALMNGQIGQVTWLLAVGLLYLPGLTVSLWRTSASRETLRGTVRRISLSVVWASLAFTLVDLTHALGPLPRRVILPGIEFRLAGITPHANLLAITAALAVFLTFRARQRFWLVHLMGCAVILFLAEARTLTVGLLVSAAGYFIVSAKKSRGVRLINVALVAAPIAVALWPAIASSFEETSLGKDVMTFNSRTVVWELVAENWTEHPALGWGAFAFDDATGSPLSVLFFQNAHNQYLESLVEGGAVGLMLMCAVVVAIAWALLTTRDAVFVAVGITTLFFTMTEVPFTLHNYGFNYTVVVGGLLLAILIPGPARTSEKAEELPASQGRLGALPTWTRQSPHVIR